MKGSNEMETSRPRLKWRTPTQDLDPYAYGKRGGAVD